MRLLSVAASLLTNIVVARRLTLGEIGIYYLYIALAYIGNAGFYVGSGVVLQRQCSSLAHTGAFHRLFLARFLAVTLLAGTLLVTLVSAGYLSRQSTGEGMWQIGLWCAALSGATYLSSVGKDLLALGGKLTIAASFSLMEQLLRLALVSSVTSAARAEALDVTRASVLALTLTGASALMALTFLSRASTEPPPKVTLGDAIHIVAPISASGLLNWLQLQSYRPVLLYLGAQPSVLGITSLLTVLGMTGANPILSVVTQTYVPRLYTAVPGALRQCVAAVGKLAGVLCIAAIPFAAGFLILSGRGSLLPYTLIVCMGILIEAGNNVISAFMHQRNAVGRSMWVLAISGSAGVLIAACSWIVPASAQALPYVIAVGMLLSQCAVIAALRVLWKR